MSKKAILNFGGGYAASSVDGETIDFFDGYTDQKYKAEEFVELLRENPEIFEDFRGKEIEADEEQEVEMLLEDFREMLEKGTNPFSKLSGYVLYDTLTNQEIR